jgi:KaiC/GvpD/RAD55 family RecA-like ATPase
MEKLRSLHQGELVVLVDTDISRENVLRAAASLGWQAKEVTTEGSGFRLTLEKG